MGNGKSELLILGKFSKKYFDGNYFITLKKKVLI